MSQTIFHTSALIGAWGWIIVRLVLLLFKAVVTTAYTLFLCKLTSCHLRHLHMTYTYEVWTSALRAFILISQFSLKVVNFKE